MTTATFASVADDLPHMIIRPPQGWRVLNVRELWQYRELLYFLTWRDVKVRYKQTILGVAWAVLQPVLMMIVFSIFFGRLAKVDSGGIPYPLFVFAGLLPWTFFSTAIANAGSSVVGSERLITKIYFPRLAIPFAAVGASLIDFIVAFGMLIVLMLWYRVTPTWNLCLAPVLLLVCTLAALGVGAMLAALNVAYRDVRYVIPFLIQLWMFATPTIYMVPRELESDESRVEARGVNYSSSADESESSDLPNSASEGRPGEARALPGGVRMLLNVNPLTGLIAAFRVAILGGPVPWMTLCLSTLSVLLAFVGGCLYFRRVEDFFADII